MQINNTSQFQAVEANVSALRARMPDLPARELELCRMIVALGRDLSNRLEHQIRPHGLSEAEFRVLTTLYTRSDGMAHSSELAIAALQSAANMSRISDALVARALITRDGSAQDRRRMVLQITGQGMALVESLLPAMFLPLHDLLGGFPASEQVQMIALLRRLGVALDRVPT